MKPVAVIYWSAWDGDGEVECFTVGQMNKAIRKLERQNCIFHTCMNILSNSLPRTEHRRHLRAVE